MGWVGAEVGVEVEGDPVRIPVLYVEEWGAKLGTDVQ